MLIQRTFLLVMMILAGTLAAIAVQHRLSQGEERLYNEMVVIKDNVRVVDQTTHDTSVRVGASLIFQRVDCKKCLVAAVTDTDGNYQLHVSRGRYKVIVREGTREGETYDVLAADQPRYVDATNVVNYNQFDIRLVYPSSLFHVTLPTSPVLSPAP